MSKGRVKGDSDYNHQWGILRNFKMFLFHFTLNKFIIIIFSIAYASWP